MMLNKTNDCEQNGLDRVMRLQLPHHWKRIGFISLLIAFGGLIVNRLLIDSEVFRECCRVGFQLSLIIMTFSKEKIEDELVQKLRLQSFYVAFITGTFYVVLLPYIGLGLDWLLGNAEPHKEPLSSFLIIAQFVGVQLLCFEILKKRYNEE